MSLTVIADGLTYIEPFLWALAFVAFVRSKDNRTFPAFRFFLGIRAISTLLLAGIYHVPNWLPSVDGHVLYVWYYWLYWASYFLSGIAVYLTLQQLFKNAMSPLPGLNRIGTVGFRWMAIISVVITAAAVLTELPANYHNTGPTYIAMNLARCISIMELCMLAFFALFIHSLGMSFRSRTFGINFGLGLMAVMYLVRSSLHSSFYSSANDLAEVVTVAALVIWVVYFMVPEPARRPVAQTASPKLMHWNAMAMQIERTTPELAAAEATGQQRGFLQDVEGVVDRVLAKNSVNNG